MKILVIAATPGEMKAIREWIKSADLKEKLDIDYLCSGIWNYETIFSLENYLAQNTEPVFIRNIWICGYWNSNNEKKSEPIQIASVINIHTEKEMIISPFLQIAPLKNCFSSENVVLDKPEFKKEIWPMDNEYYFDMESRWIELVASKYKFPRLILKVPFDFIWEEDSINKGEFKENMSKIFELLNNLPYHDYLLKILKWVNQQEVT